MRVHESFDVSGQKQLYTLKKYILMNAALFERKRQEMGGLFSQETLEHLVEINPFLSDLYNHLITSAHAYTECVIALRASNQEASQEEQNTLQEQQTIAHNAFIDSFEDFVACVYVHKDSQNIVAYLQKLEDFLEEKEVEVISSQEEGKSFALHNFSRICSSQIALFITYDRMRDGIE